ncbi:MAG: riboflavin synthase [Actinomycetaceae bacterium]|nr:riboflavin synthase [Arcanobacterium sp.]MDD7505066.1 riboflavin synthase [Actinomycetaceae bacterium]
MFTGIVQQIGEITGVTHYDDVTKIALACGYDTQAGESIAVNGVCLTVVDPGKGSFTAEMMSETLRLTTLGALEVGDNVNLERALALGDHLGGHNVQGHVDGVGWIREVVRRGNTADVTLALPPDIVANCVRKGSVALDGISLTISKRGADSITVSLIPETLQRTIAGEWEAGRAVNVEADIYVKTLRQTLIQVLPELTAQLVESGSIALGAQSSRMREAK